MQYFEELFSKYNALVFFDTETNGLDPASCQIIELAAQRLEKSLDGSIIVSASMDSFVKLRDGQLLPEKITDLTHITSKMLDAQGMEEIRVIRQFSEIISDEDRSVLLIAHNAHFDISFLECMAKWYNYIPIRERMSSADYLDTLTVFKDRAPYPHKLSCAIEHYGLQGKVKNSHRAIDDVEALVEVSKAMSAQRADLDTYINLFGYNPKYGINGEKLEGVRYYPQFYSDTMRDQDLTLPAITKTFDRMERRGQ